VQIVRILPGTGQQTTETATVLSVNAGVVLKIHDRIEVLREDSIPTRVIFDKLPDNLRARPTLSINVDSDLAGKRDVTLNYLTSGIAWKADYVALFEEKASRLDLQGWITLTNNTGTTFKDAQTQLVAGTLNIMNDASSNDRQQSSYRSSSGIAGSEPSQKAPVGDYYVYSLAERTTIADQQTKQVGFLDAHGVGAKKLYQYRADKFASTEEPNHAAVVVQFANAANSGLGAQLPAGAIRVYVRDAQGKPKFLGENMIDHTPQGSDLSVPIGEAFDVTVHPTLVQQDRVNKRRARYSMEYVLRNARSESVIVQVRQGGLNPGGKVTDENMQSTRVNAGVVQWDVPVPAGGEARLTFKAENLW
jgi:hypothetical protein